MGYFDQLGSESITVHLGTVTEVDLGKSTKVYVLLDDQTDNISMSAAIPMELPSPIPKDTLGSGMFGIPRKGQRVICARLGLRDEYVILSYYAGTSEYGQDGRFMLDGREEGEIILAAGGYYNPLIKIKPKGVILISTNPWASHELHAEERRSEIVAKRIYNMTPGSKDKKRYYDSHPVSSEDDRILHSYVVYDGKQQESVVDDDLRLEEESLLSLIPLADKYNARVIKLAGHIAYSNSSEIPGHVYERRTQQSRGTDKKKSVFTEERIGRQNEHTIEKDKLALQTFKYPEGTIYDFRLKDKDGIDGASPLTYMERIGHLSTDFIRNSGIDFTSGELYSSRLCFGGGLNVKPGDGWHQYNEDDADQSYTTSLGRLNMGEPFTTLNTFKRVRMHSTTTTSDVHHTETLSNNSEFWNVTYNDVLQLTNYEQGFGKLLPSDTINIDEVNSFYRLHMDSGVTTFDERMSVALELYHKKLRDVATNSSLYEGFGLLEDLSMWRHEVNFANVSMETQLGNAVNLYEKVTQDEIKDIKVTEEINALHHKLTVDGATAPLNQYIKVGKTGIVIEDQIYGNNITLGPTGISMSSVLGLCSLEFTATGIKIETAMGGCELNFGATGVTLSTDVGANDLTMSLSGTKINNHFLATHNFVDFFNSHKGHLGVGNKGFPVPFHPRTRAAWTPYSIPNTFKTDRT